MKFENLIKNINVPSGLTDVVLDTDAFNEADDQFAISYLVRSGDKLNVKGLCAAPFGHNSNAQLPSEGMLKSYDEIKHILKLNKREDLLGNVYKGSDRYLPDEKTPVISEATDFLIKLSKNYSEEKPLYIVGIGAITNIASALLIDPEMKNRVVVVWLGGHAIYKPHTREYNMFQDVAAARVVFGCGVPLVHVPCDGAANGFVTTRYELEHWLRGKNELCDYLLEKLIDTVENHFKKRPDLPWSCVIWDVTAVAWLLNDNDRFMTSELIHTPIPTYDYHYAFDNRRQLCRSISAIKRDELFDDLFTKLAKS